MSKNGLDFVDGEESARAMRLHQPMCQLSERSFTMHAGHVQRQFDQSSKKPFGAWYYPVLHLCHVSLRTWMLWKSGHQEKAPNWLVCHFIFHCICTESEPHLCSWHHSRLQRSYRLEFVSRQIVSSPWEFFESNSLIKRRLSACWICSSRFGLTASEPSKSLWFPQETVNLAHSLHTVFGPTICLNHSLRFLAHFFDIFWMSNEVVQSVSQELYIFWRFSGFR